MLTKSKIKNYREEIQQALNKNFKNVQWKIHCYYLPQYPPFGSHTLVLSSWLLSVPAPESSFLRVFPGVIRNRWVLLPNAIQRKGRLVKTQCCVLSHLSHQIWCSATPGSSPKSQWPGNGNILEFGVGVVFFCFCLRQGLTMLFRIALSSFYSPSWSQTCNSSPDSAPKCWTYSYAPPYLAPFLTFLILSGRQGSQAARIAKQKTLMKDDSTAAAGSGKDNSISTFKAQGSIFMEINYNVPFIVSIHRIFITFHIILNKFLLNISKNCQLQMFLLDYIWPTLTYN